MRQVGATRSAISNSCACQKVCRVRIRSPLRVWPPSGASIEMRRSFRTVARGEESVLAKAGACAGVRLVRCAFTQNVRQEAVGRRRFGVERDRVARSGGAPLVTVMAAAEAPQLREADAAPDGWIIAVCGGGGRVQQYQGNLSRRVTEGSEQVIPIPFAG
jgi:hypothetical protein